MQLSEIEAYGINWDAYHSTNIQEHYLTANPTDPFPQNPFVPHCPDTYSIVEVEGPSCPFNDWELATFQQSLSGIPLPILSSRSMADCRKVFTYALHVCNQIKGSQH